MKMVKEVNGRLMVMDMTGYREATQADFTRIENEKAQSRDRAEISSLKSKLARTDYQAIKFAEGEMSADEYAPIKAQRAEWRRVINELEEKLGSEALT